MQNYVGVSIKFSYALRRPRGFTYIVLVSHISRTLLVTLVYNHFFCQQVLSLILHKITLNDNKKSGLTIMLASAQWGPGFDSWLGSAIFSPHHNHPLVHPQLFYRQKSCKIRKKINCIIIFYKYSWNPFIQTAKIVQYWH